MAAAFREKFNDDLNTMDYPDLLLLPQHVMMKIFSYCTYAQLAELRKVCQTFNSLCKMRLTDGFRKVDQYHSQIQKQVKSKLPRRESERHSHPLARHVNILSAVETRLSLLSMTFTKYIDSDLCCFIPGKVLDELFWILRTLQCIDKKPPRAHEFLQELRDISSMAMEHFDECIVPILKQQLPGPSTSFVDEALESISTSSSPGQIRWVHSPRPQDAVFPPFQPLNTMIKTLKKGLRQSKTKISEQRKLIMEQDKKLAELTSRLDRQDTKIADMTQKMLLCDKKFTDIFSAIPKLKSWTETTRSGIDFGIDTSATAVAIPLSVSKKPVRTSKRKVSNDTKDDEPSSSYVKLRKRAKK
ncbi:hypothetical protein SNE40_010606 [Patella caerulea]|uniref:F-box domain-containing protein n=2 Tax=Patella caerulea TaxID=87958 RepID=A0AAN8JVH5_PATCE